MDVFKLDSDLIARYQAFARSFTSIRAPDLKDQIDQKYAADTFWPAALIGLRVFP